MSNITVNLEQARKCIERVIKKRRVPVLLGSPGCGKSDLVREIAAQFNLKLIDLRLAQCDITDLNGFPQIQPAILDSEGKVLYAAKASYVPMDTFPLEGEPLPQKADGSFYEGWLLFLDELNHADRSVQKSSYKLILDRMVGNTKLHSNVAIVGAGNLDTDGAFTEEMSTALQSRVVHFELAINPNDWLEWAVTHNIDHRVTSYIRFKPDLLHNFKPDSIDQTYPCPRTWQFVSDFLEGETTIGRELLPVIAGTIGQGAAREFKTFTQIYKDLLTIPQIVANPEGVKVPSEPAIQYALTGTISNNATDVNIGKLITFVNRLPVEFQVICMREIVRRKKELVKTPAVEAWITNNATKLF